MPPFDLGYNATENPDWGCARTLRTVLMVPSSEWVQSVFSCKFGVGGREFAAPNRDYPYEGLMAHHDGEHWRFIDCIALGLQSFDGRWAVLLDEGGAASVRVHPFCVTYRYRYLGRLPNGLLKEMPISVSYRLNSATPPGLTTGSVKVSLIGMPAGAHAEAVVWLQPFVDVRHMYAHSDFGCYRIQFSPSQGTVRRVKISSGSRSLTFYVPPGELNRFDSSPEFLTWNYKMGSGNRGEDRDPWTGRPATQFFGKTGVSAAFFNVRPRFLAGSSCARLLFCCSSGPDCQQLSVADLERIAEDSEQQDEAKLRQVQERTRISPRSKYYRPVVSRVIGLTKFKVWTPLPGENRNVRVPPAGAWWFRTPWFRDVFEGVLSSFRTLMSLPDEREMIKDSVLLALAHQHPSSGLIPNRVPEFKGQAPSFNSSDATLLCLITACRYLQEVWDEPLALKVVTAAERMIDAFVEAGLRQDAVVDGPPWVDPATCLLLSAPHHSWIDTRCQCVEYAGARMEGLPNRVSARFVKDLWQHVEEKERVGALLSMPRFFLPETNAQWIVMLGELESLLGRPDGGQNVWAGEFSCLQQRIAGTLASARSNFLRVFWNKRKAFLYNVVYEDRKVRDCLECEAAVTAAAMLGKSVFAAGQLEAVWQHARNTLLIRRRLVRLGDAEYAFGLLARKEDRRVFYGDKEYHADVIWPRSTPYLVQLLRLLGHRRLVRELIVCALDHQMSEGAIFYNHELFSRPCGNNPRRDPRTAGNPVPVKNPIQFWSQWCDGIMGFSGKGGTDPCLEKAPGRSTSSRP